MLQVVFSFLLSLEVRDFGKEKKRKSTEGTSGHVDGVGVENSASWPAAQIRPRTVGSWQQAGWSSQTPSTAGYRRLARVAR